MLLWYVYCEANIEKSALNIDKKALTSSLRPISPCRLPHEPVKTSKAAFDGTSAETLLSGMFYRCCRAKTNNHHCTANIDKEIMNLGKAETRALQDVAGIYWCL